MPTTSANREYYEHRALEERAMASASASKPAAKAHRDMALRYDALARGEDVLDERSFDRLTRRLGVTKERVKRLSDLDADLIVRSDELIENSRLLLRATSSKAPPGKPPHAG